MDFAVILFLSSNHSIWAARFLKKEGIEHRMIPVPRHLSSDCGYCIRIKKEDISRVEKLIKDKNILYDKIEEL